MWRMRQELSKYIKNCNSDILLMAIKITLMMRKRRNIMKEISKSEFDYSTNNIRMLLYK